MERGSKRKAAMAGYASSPPTHAAEKNSPRAAKRQKTPEATRRVSAVSSGTVAKSAKSATGETAEGTTEIGLRLIESLKNAADNHGRQYTEPFHSLPDRDEFPDYYEQIALPVAFDTIEDKLNERQYPTLTTLESDVKRLVSNAKAYNERTSEIFAGAERIRKLLFNFMKRHNPAYKDPSYTAFPTPLPGEESDAPQEAGTLKANGVIRISSPVKKLAAQKQNNSTRSSRVAKVEPEEEVVEEIVEEVEEEVEEEVDPNIANLTGKTFQDAQEHIVEELIEYTEGDLRIYEPFLNLPSRSLTDYYALIKQPMSLRGVQRKVRGIHGRSDPTNQTDMKSWDAFEAEMAKIWTNAREYNEDGSDMYNLAGELEDHFQEIIDAARKVVEEPAQPTLKLKMAAAPPPIKLRFGAQKGSPVPTDSASPTPTAAAPTTISKDAGISVDHAALERQRASVQAGINGAATHLRPRSSRSISQHVSSTTDAATSSIPARQLPDDIVNGHAGTPSTSHAHGSESPMPNGLSSIPNHRPDSKSPHPTTSTDAAHPPIPPPIPAPAPPPPDTRLRPAGKDATSALFNPVLITTPAHLPLPSGKPFTHLVKAHPRFAQQSVTLHLPSTHHTLLLTPTIRPQVFESGLYRLFVTVNGMRVMGMSGPPLPLPPPIAPVPGAGPGGPAPLPPGSGVSAAHDPRRPTHEARLGPGVNRIEIEMVAEPLLEDEVVVVNGVEDGAEDAETERNGNATANVKVQGQGQGKGKLDVERLSVFVHLMRSSL